MTITTIKDIQDANAKIVAAMIEKGCVTPSCDVWVSSDGFTVHLSVHRDKGPRIGDIFTDYGRFICDDDLDRAYSDAVAFVDAMATPEIAALQRHMKGMADLADKGRADGIPDEYIDPLSVTIKAMTDNLLTHEVTS